MQNETKNIIFYKLQYTNLYRMNTKDFSTHSDFPNLVQNFHTKTLLLSIIVFI